MVKITSRDNAAIKLLFKILSSRKERRESGLFVLEGERLVCEAIDNDVSIECLYITEDRLNKTTQNEKILSHAKEILLVEDNLFKRVADTKTPQGISALCKGELTLRELPTDLSNGTLLLCSLQDPGNVGAIIRTAEALGLSAVAITSDCPDISSPKVLRASMGALFRIAVVEFESAKSAIDSFRERGVVVYASTISEGSLPVLNTDLKGCCIAIGNEGAGLSIETIEYCDKNIMIPIASNSESLNAAMAAGIFAWELKRAVTSE